MALPATATHVAAAEVALLVKSKIAMEIAAQNHGLATATATMVPTSGMVLPFS